MVMSTIKKGLVIGLAVAKLSKEEASRTVRFLVKQGGLSQKEGRRLLGQVVAESEKEKQRLKKYVKQKMLTEKEAAMLRKEVVQLRKSLKSAVSTGKKVAGSISRRTSRY